MERHVSSHFATKFAQSSRVRNRLWRPQGAELEDKLSLGPIPWEVSQRILRRTGIHDYITREGGELYGRGFHSWPG
jgi:hypothetical protein